MSYIVGDEREQASLLPARLEDYVGSAAPVRVIDVFVDGLDMIGLGFGRAVPALTGRPGYDPRDLLKLYVWGYFNEVRSSRRLERECGRNVEAMWLLRRLAPDFKTIADFRRDNGPAIVGACRAFVLLCREAGLFAARLVALDGSKFRAAASAKKIVGRREIEEQRARLDLKIAAWLAGLDEADAAEPDDRPGAAEAAIAALRTRRGELDRLAAKLEGEGRTTLVEGEEDARPMGKGKGRKPPAYNVQTAVDADTGLILHHEVTDEATDNRMLHPMASAAKAVLERDALMVVADAGYSNGAQASACEAEGITPCAPANRAINNQGDGTLFDRSVFLYEADSDTFRCPAGPPARAKATASRQRKRHLRLERLLGLCAEAAMHHAAAPLRHPPPARGCAQPHEERATPDMMRKRRCAAEHPFGIIKRMMAGGRFLTRNLKATRTEMALSVIAYNMRRAINITAAAA